MQKFSQSRAHSQNTIAIRNKKYASVLTKVNSDWQSLEFKTGKQKLSNLQSVITGRHLKS
jgi:hypothetical protein